MKVLLTNVALDYFAGSEIYTYEVAKTLHERGHEVYVYTLAPGVVSDKLKEIGIKVMLPESCDVVHLHHVSCAREICARFPNVPKIQVIHGVLPSEESPYDHKSIKRYVAVSEEILDKVGDCTLIRSFTDTERFCNITPPSYPVKRVMILANQLPRKTFDDVTTACDSGGIECRVIGSNSFVNTPTWDVESFINRSDLVVSMGKGVLQAVACGRNVLVGGKYGWAGLLTNESYEKIREKNFSGRGGEEWDSMKVLKALGEATPKTVLDREIILENHSLEKAVTEFEQLYRKVMDEV